MTRVKHAVYNTLQFSHRSKLTYAINSFIILLILLSVPIDVIESLNDASPVLKRWILHTDLFISFVFALEYALRLITCTADPRYSRPIAGRIKYMLTPLMLIDLLAISPFFILGVGYLRMLRVFRILMLMRYTNAIELMDTVISKKKSELMICGAFILMLWVWSAFTIYRVEHVAQPEVFKNMLDALWWSAETFTTLGYGDIVPITYFGKAIAICTVALGLMLFAITTAVLTAGIVQEIQRFEKSTKKPPEV